MSPAEVSVVVPAWNEQAHLEAALRSAWDNGAGQVIVSDGGSEDATVALARQGGAEVVEGPRGRGRQLRLGAGQARGKLLLFLHGDSQLGPGCLQRLARCWDQGGGDDRFWGGFRQRIAADGALYRLIEAGNAARIRLRGVPFGDQALFVTRTLYDRVGGFPDVPLMEDVRLSAALRRHRWPVLVDGPVVVDARRWQRRGVIRQTCRNWTIQLAHAAGVSEQRLASWYR
jgi:rSAM/selenodomain-associated transferase 2